ncbi:hypothetical protein FH610_015675 [Microbispora catharanthi]|uniref:Uncharacterized protein n=1 Tax=Microbispora catharanthi TaxID=1712871 RepID=A0A5N6BVL4_9ACTN|nr:replication initiator [Microbispora catharanthi]KAB8184536.1 hypothetical protein FH610_015675 [Microbispora catharanthi]
MSWNAHPGNLWRRFTIYLRRHLAASAGLTRKDFDRMVRVSSAKDEGVIPPPAWATVDLLSDAIRTAVKAVRLDAPDLGQPTRHLVWSDQVDVRRIDPGELHDGHHLSGRAVATYVAKYATKAAETSGTLDRRVKPHDLPTVHEQGVSEHAARLIRTLLHQEPHLLDHPYGCPSGGARRATTGSSAVRTWPCYSPTSLAATGRSSASPPTPAFAGVNAWACAGTPSTSTPEPYGWSGWPSRWRAR